jgi:hypothetical protein
MKIIPRHLKELRSARKALDELPLWKKKLIDRKRPSSATGSGTTTASNTSSDASANKTTTPTQSHQ